LLIERKAVPSLLSPAAGERTKERGVYMRHISSVSRSEL
jgi:hypothetical protein